MLKKHLSSIIMKTDLQTKQTTKNEAISELLQKELPGLKGFSDSAIKRMRTFYEGWNMYISNRPTSLDDLTENHNDTFISNHPLILKDFSEKEIELFLSIGFSHHYEILIKTDYQVLRN